MSEHPDELWAVTLDDEFDWAEMAPCARCGQCHCVCIWAGGRLRPVTDLPTRGLL